MNPSKQLGSHLRYLPAAEAATRSLIASIFMHGIHESHSIDPDSLPNPIFKEVLNRTLDAMLNHGAQDYSDVHPYLLTASQAVREEASDCSLEVPPHPSSCGPLIEIIQRYDTARHRQLTLWQIAAADERGESTTELTSKLAEIDAAFFEDSKPASKAKSLRERAYSMRFDPAEVPPLDETCMVIGDIPIAARGNLTVPQGKSKVGKSALISAILGAAHRGNFSAAGDTLCVEWRGEATGAIVHLDTEQSRSDWHALVCRGIHRSGLSDTSPRLVSLPLVMFSRSERLDILRETLNHERSIKGSIDLVLIDGVADLCISPNAEAESLELVSQLHALAQEFHCPIFCVLHENPSGEGGKTRGHLGSELNRKAFANLRIDKDQETSVSTIYGTDMRKRDIPKEQGFCFAWNDEAGMHTFQGRAAGLKAAQRDEKATEDSREFFTEIFGKGDAIGKNGQFPIMTLAAAVASYRETIGNGKDISSEAMKKRLQKGESLGVLGKASRNEWKFIPSGTSGNHREKGENSRP